MASALNEVLKNHPLWKGFPLKVWPHGDEEFKAANILPTPLSSATAMGEDFYVLSLSQDGAHWSGPEAPGVSVSVVESEENVEPIRDVLDEKLRSKIKATVELRVEESLAKPVALLLDSALTDHWDASAVDVHVGESVHASFYVGPQTISELRSQRIRFFCANHSMVQLLFAESTTVQRWSHHVIEAQVEQDAEFHASTLASAVGLGRNEVHVRLMAPGSRGSVSGIHLLNSNQTYDSRVTIRHFSPNTWSRQNFKCVVADRAQSMFGGQILIDREAQGVDAGQSHKALLISPTAKALAFPELEVKADDVKAAHGSSVGRMDPEQIFYFKSRGLSENDSLRLLGEAFVRDVVMKISQPQLKKRAELILSRILPQFIQGLEDKMRLDS